MCRKNSEYQVGRLKKSRLVCHVSWRYASLLYCCTHTMLVQFVVSPTGVLSFLTFILRNNDLPTPWTTLFMFHSLRCCLSGTTFGELREMVFGKRENAWKCQRKHQTHHGLQNSHALNILARSTFQFSTSKTDAFLCLMFALVTTWNLLMCRTLMMSPVQTRNCHRMYQMQIKTCCNSTVTRLQCPSWTHTEHVAPVLHWSLALSWLPCGSNGLPFHTFNANIWSIFAWASPLHHAWLALYIAQDDRKNIQDTHPNHATQGT